MGVFGEYTLLSPAKVYVDPKANGLIKADELI